VLGWRESRARVRARARRRPGSGSGVHGVGHEAPAQASRSKPAVTASEPGISSSALSQSVRQLEARLGVTLLFRTTRSVALTDPGRRLLEQAGTAVDQALEALKTVSARAGEVTGRIRLTLPAIAVPCARRRPRGDGPSPGWPPHERAVSARARPAFTMR
jgi:hypothetical protein